MTLDETGVIESIVAGAGRSWAGYSAIGDDVAVGPVKGENLVLKVDMLVERTDMPPGMTYREAARKVVAMCVSDFAAKGVRPDSFMVSLGLRRGTTKEEIGLLGAGFRDAQREWGVKLLGGDTNEAGELVLDCTMVGFAKRVVWRKGASPGDFVVVSGEFGFPPAGLRILMRGSRAAKPFAKVAVRSVLKPSPNIAVGVALGRYLTSSMDSSDGLAISLHTLASSSGVGLEVDRLPTGKGVAPFARENGLPPEKLVLEGGEEYLIVGTVRPGKFEAARRAARRAGGDLIRIGAVTPKPGSVLLSVNGTAKPIRNVGWTHLASSLEDAS